MKVISFSRHLQKNTLKPTVGTSIDSNTPNIVHVDGSTPVDAAVDEAFTATVAPQEMANTVLDSPTSSRLRAEVLPGHTTTVLVANDGSVEGKDLTQGFIICLISIINNDLKTESGKSDKNSVSYYKMRMLPFTFQTSI